jgi:hypothetical protein
MTFMVKKIPPMLLLLRCAQVTLLGFTMLKLNDWKKQLLIHTFHHQTRLKSGALMDIIRAWREEHRANPAYVTRISRRGGLGSRGGVL